MRPTKAGDEFVTIVDIVSRIEQSFTIERDGDDPFLVARQVAELALVNGDVNVQTMDVLQLRPTGESL